MRARLIAVIVAVGLLTGCSGASPSPTPIGSGEPLPPSACPAISLRTPAGRPVDLTGRWRGRDGGTYYLRQSASCVWITGFSVGTGSPGGEGATDYTNVFFGHLASDFTFSGVWADMPWGRGTSAGTVTWKVDFANVDGTEAMTVRVIEVTNGSTLSLVQPDDTDVTLAVRLQDNDSCPLVTSEDGQDYELIVGAPGWRAFGAPPRLVGPNDLILIPSDPVEISGQVALGTSDCGTDRVLIADRIEPAPTP